MVIVMVGVIVKVSVMVRVSVSVRSIYFVNAPVVAAVFSRARCDYLCFTRFDAV